MVSRLHAKLVFFQPRETGSVHRSKNNMAEEIGDSAVPSGYDYDFISLIDDDFICQICHLPLKKAVLTRCGHRFCNECLSEYFRR